MPCHPIPGQRAWTVRRGVRTSNFEAADFVGKVEAPVVDHLSNYATDCEEYEVVKFFFIVGR